MSGEDARLVRRLLVGGPEEFQEGAPSMEPANKTSTDGGDGSVSVSNILSVSGSGNVNFWGGDLGFFRGNVQEDGGGACGVTQKGEGKDVQAAEGRTWINTAVERLLKEAGTHKLGTYIDGRNLAVAEWVALRPKLEVCDR